MDQQFIKGIPFSTLEYAKAISLLKGWLYEQQEKPRFVVTANPEIVMSAKENTEKSKEFKKDVTICGFNNSGWDWCHNWLENIKRNFERTCYWGGFNSRFNKIL